jgi:hypothetical protein
MKFHYTIFLLLFLVFGCIDEFDVKLPFDESKLVADILISSEPDESSISIGWSFPTGGDCLGDGPFGPQPVSCGSDSSSGQNETTCIVSIQDLDADQSWTYEFVTEKKSFYQFKPELLGVAGHTYSLKITVTSGNEEHIYTAQTTMLRTPNIDDIAYEIRKGDVGKDDNFVPLISFKEPRNERNYYLFQLCEAYRNSGPFCGMNSRVWNYSTLSDDFLPEDVKRLSIDDGATVAKYAEFYPHVHQDVGARVRMFSVSKEIYSFYNVLIDQFNSDGGAYSPTPGAPKGNINGENVIGLFRAVHPTSGVIFLLD